MGIASGFFFLDHMSRLLDWVDGRVLLTDGAWGTELQKRGLPTGASADLWNLIFPERVADVAQSYVDAGSQVILTNTFRANRISLGDFGLADRVADINKAGVQISRHAAAGRARVAGSMGPIGSEAAFAEQAEALAAAGVEAIVLETFTDLTEARTALKAVLHTGLPVVTSFAFGTAASPAPGLAAHVMAEEGADAVGANCGTDIASFAVLCRQMRAACDLPVWIKPSAGLPEFQHETPEYRVSADEFALHARAAIEAGASFVGGCCGTTPDYISALWKWVK